MRRSPHSRFDRLSRFQAGALALALIAGVSLLGWFRVNPFHDAHEVKAAFRSAVGVQSRTPVRIAGIDVGKVTKVEALDGGGALVTMELDDNGLPVHADAEADIRQRIIFEGNFYIDLHPGSPSEKTLSEGATIPLAQTSGPVQAGEILSALQADTRADTQTLVQELGRALADGGADSLNRTARHLEPAYRNLALASDATLGERPDRDLVRALRGTRRTLGALGEDEQELQTLVSGTSTVFGALARQDAALEASLPALRDLLRSGYPALGAVNAGLTPLRELAREAQPGVRALSPALDAALPFLHQARLLVGPHELRRTARALRSRLPALAALNRSAVPLFAQGRAASRCTERVLVPFVDSDFPDPDFPANSGTVNQKLQRSFVGLAGESRAWDANQSFFNISSTSRAPSVRPAPPPDSGHQPPPRRPDVPCETQEAPNLQAPAAGVEPGVGLVEHSSERRLSSLPSLATRRSALRKARAQSLRWFEGLARKRERILRREAKR